MSVLLTVNIVCLRLEDSVVNNITLLLGFWVQADK